MPPSAGATNLLAMLPRRLPSAAAALLLAVLTLGLGCGGPSEEGAKREGLDIELGGVTYNVFITRQLNLRDPEDADYFKGPDPAPGSTYYGVFLRACNAGEAPVQAAGSFKIVDTFGAEFEPVELPPENVFAFRARQVAPEECIPVEASAAATGPTGGSLLVFELPVAAGENRPLELEILGFDPAEGKQEAIRVELDI